MKPIKLILLAAVVGSCQDGTLSSTSDVLTGGVFTTTADGGRVDANIYSSKDDVYLDGGPSANAPSAAAALPAGDYYFQVTDPSGKTLLSSDDISCRRFRIDDSGVIAEVYPGTGGCMHKTGTDQDHDGLTVQLMPYADTPNPGGEYKVWVTAVADYSANGGVHGFVHKDSKTDNFKVRAGGQEPPPACGNGTVETPEQCDDGNTVSGDGCSATCTTEVQQPCCGDGHLDTGEQCDDGNTTSGDGCSATCTIEPPPPCCGDGHLDAGEACDDGNTTAGDGCSATCTIETPVCGDGHLDTGEVCDDGNTTAGDGCSATCTIEPPPPVCGDGHLDAGEGCDDGNTTSGDGCSSTCVHECPCP